MTGTMGIRKFKDLLFIVIVAVNMLGCSSAGEEKGLGYGLVCFTEHEDDGSILKGVRRISDNRIMVSPALYNSITADSCFIIASKGAFSHDVWKTDGTHIGTFDTFTGFSRGYYIGTLYRTTCYYFPKYDLLLRSESVQQGKHGICIEVNGQWQVRAYDGKLLWEGDVKPEQEEWDKTYNPS